MLRKLLIIKLFILLLSHNSLGQQELNNWIFGDKVQLNFSTSPPTIVPNSSFSNTENASVISDEFGNLLFYTNGTSIINKNHFTMENGLFINGHSSSAQNLIIKGFNPDEYFIFTVEACVLKDNKLSMSKVDLSYNGGLGKVTKKNQIIHQGYIGEGISAFKHCNQKDYWICIKTYSNDPQILSFLLTENENPFAPTVNNVSKGKNCEGYLKSSPNGKLLAWNGGSFIADFDNSNGKISNIRTINKILNSTQINNDYSCEFSPNSKKLYSSAGLMVDITTLKTDTVFVGNRGAMQLANDGKIYISHFQFLDVINNPNQDVSGINYIENSIDLLGANTSYSTCNFSATFFDSADFFIHDFKCSNQEVSFFYPDSGSVDSINWVIGNSIISGNSIDFLFTSNGTQGVSMIKFHLGGNDTIHQCIEIYSEENHFLSNDTVFCHGEELIIFPAKSIPGKLLWNTGDTLPFIIVDEEGLYSLEISNECLFINDTISVSINPECPVSPIVVPNVFSPNNDYYNDYLEVKIPDNQISFSEISMKIYNRWGNIVYSSNPITNPWDGKLKSKDLSPGVYFWTLNIDDKISKNGFVHLVR